MKAQYHLTENEMIAFFALCGKVLDIMDRRINSRDRAKVADALMAALKRDAKDAADDLDADADADADIDADADNDDCDTDTDPDDDNVTPFPGAAVFVPPADPQPSEAEREQAEQERVKVLHGKDVWIALIEVWRQGFMVEGAPQPDRVANLSAAASPHVMAYIRTKAGITDATREAIYLLDGGDPEGPYTALTSAQRREARLIAENIAQVASFHAPWFTEQLEYAYDFRTLPKED